MVFAVKEMLEMLEEVVLECGRRIGHGGVWGREGVNRTTCAKHGLLKKVKLEVVEDVVGVGVEKINGSRCGVLR